MTPDPQPRTPDAPPPPPMPPPAPPPPQADDDDRFCLDCGDRDDGGQFAQDNDPCSGVWCVEDWLCDQCYWERAAEAAASRDADDAR